MYFKCNLEDRIVTRDSHNYIRIGKVIALDDDGFVTIESFNDTIRIHNDWIIDVFQSVKDELNAKSIYGRRWLYEVKTELSQENGDYLLGIFSEGELWMNTIINAFFLVQPNGVCLMGY